jgi:hypothetical protein
MEGLVRLVAESLERYGISTPPAPIEWSAWMSLESSLCLSAPSHPGLFAVAERVLPHGLAVLNVQSHLAILKIGHARDLGFEIGRLCSPHSSLHARISTGRCVIRFAVVEDAVQCNAAHAAFQQWFTNSLSTTGTSIDAEFPPDLAAVVSPSQPSEVRCSAEPVVPNSALKRETVHPAPLPSGF